MIRSVLSTAVVTGIAAALLAVYLLPVLIGWIRRVPDIGSVAVLNILLGWTMVGWAVALALALRSVRPPSPAVQVVQSLPPAWPWPAPPSPGRLPPAGWAGQPGAPAARRDPPPLVLPPRPAGAWDPDDSGRPEERE